MIATVFRKTLRDEYRGLIGWSTGIVAIAGLEIALWPSLQDMPNFDKLLEGYPEPLKELFNIGEMATGAGFLNAELFSLTIPVMFLIYAIGRGIRLTAGEEESGTFEVLLTSPVSRIQVLIGKAAAFALTVAVLGAVLLITTWVGSSLTGMDIALGSLASACIAMTLLGIEFGLVSLAIGGAWGKRAAGLAVVGSLAVAAYVLFATTSMVEELQPWRVVSPFYQATEGGPIGAGLPARLMWLPLVGLVAFFAALPIFDRRDIAS